MMEEMILIGDIGGTNSRIALCKKTKPVVLLEEKKYPSKSYQDFNLIIKEYLKEKQVEIHTACFGIAGPVKDGKCKTTNLPWEVDSQQIARSNRIQKVSIINDLEANAWGIRGLKKNELYPLYKGQPQKGNAGLISAGTGLGEAGLIWDGISHRPFACEGGHCDFAPRNEIEWELFKYLQKKYGHVSYERVISGPGMQNLLEFLIETQKEKVSKELQSALKNESPPKVITEMGKKKEPLCKKTLDWFLSLYGAEAGNLALKFLSFSGIYLGGGIAPRIVEEIKKGPFLEAFFDKGRFKKVMQAIPVYIILNDQTALIGAAEYALQEE